MDEKLNADIMDKLTKVCLCKGIPRSSIKKAILEGADTLEKVQRKTGAGSGGCGGKRCTPKILELLEQHNNGEW
ncbi:BFD-like [2Fe-2S] binding domain protein [Caloramator mitchellensis]|uniref:BFD-like [2Fe-2S] binding domain protein n=1 Tax=Caloramator mitchellensis TaxID=908809 RepID=A0A0R3JTN2_CALMK|nr:(2Fe-2S)-binding protein [Caloramator mitchellensis]KRQ86903.1 BFD-like [2Fe-2S] binding domain protein [Caloramator mitchellensis]